MLLAASVQRAFLAQEITLTRGYKEFADVFACTEPETNPILIVAVAKVHEKHKKGNATGRAFHYSSTALPDGTACVSPVL